MKSKRISIIAIGLSVVIIGLLLWVSTLQKGRIMLVLEEQPRYTQEELFAMTQLDASEVYTFDDIPYIIQEIESISGVSLVTTQQTMQGVIEVSVQCYPPVAMVQQGLVYTFIDKMGILYQHAVPDNRLHEYPLFTGLHSWKGSDYEVRSLLADLDRIYQEFPAFQTEVSEICFDGVTSSGEYRAIVYPVRYAIEVIISADISGKALQKGWELMESLHQEGKLVEYTTFGITEEGVMYQKVEQGGARGE